MARLLVCWAALWALGCHDPSGQLQVPTPDASWEDSALGDPSVEIGVPDKITGLGFVSLKDGGDVPLQSFGQGGTHASLAIRCVNFGKRAFVDVTIENLDTGDTITSPEATYPMLLLCRDGGPNCDLIPLFVPTGGLAEPDEKDNLPIRITAEVRNTDGQTASTTAEGVLRRQ